MRELLNGGGVLSLARLLVVGPPLLVWHLGEEAWISVWRPWLSGRLIAYGKKLAH